MEQPLTVQAEYSFRGGNNDELCFKKGDIITVTQTEEGGWWEGTLGDKTGWFPSNYVKEYKAPIPITDIIRPPEEIQEYRSVVLKDLLESERAHVAEIQGLLENFLGPLQTSQILTIDEYAQLMCNFTEVVQTHEELLLGLEDCNDRVGKLFLTKAPIMKSVHQAYCAAHPRAIVILDKYKDELEAFMERQGAASPGLLVLTTGLSKPFRRLDKYSAMLQELERHMESSHPDRGDTQRSVSVYKDIAATCSATRRQKELELQVLTGPVRGWQGQELSTLGDIIHMGSVAVGPDHRDRYFVLFPQTLLILSVSQRMSAFIYEGKLPLTGIIVQRLEDTDTIKNAFEINGPLIEKIVAVCQGPNEANKWVELLSSANPSLPINIKRNISNSTINSSQTPSHSSLMSNYLDTRGYCSRFSICAYNLQYLSYHITLPPKSYPPTAPYASLSVYFEQLLQSGKLSRQIMKTLLYPEAMKKINIDEIMMRRRHKTTIRMLRKKTKDESEDKNDKQQQQQQQYFSRQDAFELPTDSESELGSCDSNPFSYIKFYTGKKPSQTDIRWTDYETFIDHGEDCEMMNYKIAANNPSNCERHSSKVEIFTKGPSNDDKFENLIDGNKKESLLICSKAVRAVLEKRPSSQESCTMHTSTARLNLGEIKQQLSERSHISNFDARISGNYMACENLANLDDEVNIKKGKKTANKDVDGSVIPDERHSMPTLFVGNRFNNSDTTEVYIPSWKDRSDLQKQQQKQNNKCSENESDAKNRCKVIVNNNCKFKQNSIDEENLYRDDDSIATHSSSIDLPALMPAPDNISAEVLYNLNDDDDDNNNDDDENVANDVINNIIPPPSMFSNDPVITLNSKEFKTDNKNSPESNRRKQSIKRSSSNSSVRRCISYQYVQLAGSNPNPSTKINIKRNNHKGNPSSATVKCKCCESSQCPSPRSSDSGMAGSCTIETPDPPKLNDDDCHQFPAQMLNSTAPGVSENSNDGDSNELRYVQSSSDLTRFDVCGMFRNKFFLRSSATQDDTNNNITDQIQTKRNNRNSCSRGRGHSLERSLVINRNSIRLDFPPRFEEITNNSDGEDNFGMYKTGLYAHWWKKEKLPNALIRDIYLFSNRKNNSTENDDSIYCDANSSCSSCKRCCCCKTESCSTGSSSGVYRGSDVSTSKSGHESSEPRYPPNTSTVPTQTEPIIQSSSQLQSISNLSSSTASTSKSTATTKSSKSTSTTKPQIKFSPDIEQHFKNTTSNSNKSTTKRKDRKHKS